LIGCLFLLAPYFAPLSFGVLAFLLKRPLNPATAGGSSETRERHITTMLFLEFARIVSDEQATFDYLNEKHLLSSAAECTRCCRKMSLQRSQASIDSRIFRCCKCKRKFKRICGAVRGIIPSYLDEFMWLERHGKTFISR
jgi:hypothetical protein